MVLNGRNTELMDYELERMWKEVVIAHFRVVCNHVTETNGVFPLSRWPVVGLRYQ